MNLVPTIPVHATAAAANAQRLNPLDIALRSVDQTIRGLGYSGFETQMLLWLAGRVDVERLRRGIERLAIRHPVIASRLVEPAGSGSPAAHWQFQPAEAACLNQIDLSDDTPESVFRFAASQISRPRPLDSRP